MCRINCNTASISVVQRTTASVSSRRMLEIHQLQNQNLQIQVYGRDEKPVF